MAAEAAAAAALWPEDVLSGCVGRCGDICAPYMALAASVASGEETLGWYETAL